MKKSISGIVVFIICCIICCSSCKKNYHCQCSYNNQVKLVKDLGLHVKKDAQDICNSYDTTVTGEKWTCVLD